MEARLAFDAMSTNARWEEQNYYDMKFQGATSQTSTDFFLQQYMKKADTTGNLVWAKENMRNVKREALQAHAISAYNSWFQESNFIDHPDDGYRTPSEAEMAAHCPTKKVEA